MGLLGRGLGSWFEEDERGERGGVWFTVIVWHFLLGLNSVEYVCIWLWCIGWDIPLLEVLARTYV
jgi:hypothetical protein